LATQFETANELETCPRCTVEQVELDLTQGGNKNKEQQQKVTSHLGSKKQTKEEERVHFDCSKGCDSKECPEALTSAAQLIGRSVTGRLIQDAG
jgi:hypothetical protein